MDHVDFNVAIYSYDTFNDSVTVFRYVILHSVRVSVSWNEP
jgi:hypothetical protein